MQRIFQYDKNFGTVELNVPEILLTKEFSELMDNERNICKEDPKGTAHLRAYRELKYIYLAIDWQSPYQDYLAQEKHEEALRDAELTEEEFNDPKFRAACRKYLHIQDLNRSVRMLQAAQGTVDKFVDYFNNIDPEERDDLTGKPIWKVKDIMAELSSLSKVLDELEALESQVKKGLSDKSNIRAGAEDGFFPKNLG